MSLTDTAVRKAKPADKIRRLFDGGGLYLELMPTGARYWRLKYRHAGKEKRLALGVYPTVTLAAAREAREKAKATLRLGRDPSIEKRTEKLRASVVQGNPSVPWGTTGSPSVRLVGRPSSSRRSGDDWRTMPTPG